MNTNPAQHVWVIGATKADRQQRIAETGEHTVVASTHRHLRGPYTGVDTVLRQLLPVAAEKWPMLIEQHRVELLHAMPHLAAVIGPAPASIANTQPYQQRTRFFHAGMVRPVSNSIVTFLIRHADYVVESGQAPLSLVFDDVTDAEQTTTEFLAFLVRRANPERLRVVLAGTAAELPAELASALKRYTSTVEAPPVAAKVTSESNPHDLVRAYVYSDGVSDDPAHIAAYNAADPDLVTALHDERAADLTAQPEQALPVGAIPYHHERGSDPHNTGRRALLAALQYCVEIGFSHAIVDIGYRGRVITDPVEHAADFCEFTMQTAYAAVDLGRVQEGLDLCMELRRRYTDPKVQMGTSYAIAMLHTRFVTPRDHETAVAWQNNAIAIAHLLPEADENRRLQIGFQDNALALIEMHRGNLSHALDLVQTGIDRLNQELSADQWVMHRTQLVHNRARLLAALGRLDEAQRDYATLIALDPYYTEYLTDRAKIARRQGNIAAALADYDRAVELAPPFPELYYNRGTARLEAGDEDGALADFTLVIELEPTEIDSRIAGVEILVARGAYDDARERVIAGLDLKPADPQLLCALGTIALECGDPQQATQWLDDALASDPDYPAALVNRAVAMFQLGEPTHATHDLTRTLELIGNNPDVLLNRGQAYAAAGRPDEAIADFNLALTLPDADTSELHRHLAKTLTGKH